MIEVLVDIFGWEVVASARSQDYTGSILANRDSLIATGRELLASMKLGQKALHAFTENLDIEVKYQLVQMLATESLLDFLD